jgi:hypothetical protein
MDPELLPRHFHRLGARALVCPGAPGSTDITFDVERDRRGERFVVRLPNDEPLPRYDRRGRRLFWPRRADPAPMAPREVEVLDVRPKERHLLVLTRDGFGAKHRFLCGHDERHWFVAAIPEKARGVTNVVRAMEALRPEEVREAVARAGVNGRRGLNRRNAAFVRQGEWFFVPAPDFEPGDLLMHPWEPISRGGRSKSHRVEEVCRTLGEKVYVGRGHEGGVTEEERKEVDAEDQRLGKRRRRWEVRVRNALVYGRGRVRHPDHNTIRLNGWHRILMNTENQAQAMRWVAFLD